MLHSRRLLAYVACTILFTLANAAMPPAAGMQITKDESASLIIAGLYLDATVTGDTAVAADGLAAVTIRIRHGAGCAPCMISAEAAQTDA